MCTYKPHIFCEYSGHTSEVELENSLTFPVSKIVIATRVSAMMIKPFLEFAIPRKKWKDKEIIVKTDSI